MNLNIKATNTTITDAIRDFIDEKIEDHLSKFLKNNEKVFVELQVDKKHKSGDLFRVEISINPPKFYAESRGADFHEAMDLAIPKVKEQLIKAKDKKISNRRK